MTVRRLLPSFAAALLTIVSVTTCVTAQGVSIGEALSIEIGKRIISITVPVKNEEGKVLRFVHGSGYMLDERQALTAAHVVRNLHVGDPLVVQVGSLALGTNYLTTARVLRFDARRDLAMLGVDTGVMDLRTRLDSGPAKICGRRPKVGDEYFLGGVSQATTGELGIERHWRPLVYGPVLSPSLAPEMAMQDPLRYWEKGDRAILSGQNANPGDSGAAVVALDGCLMGVVSMNAVVKKPVDGMYLDPMFIVPISANDAFISARSGEHK